MSAMDIVIMLRGAHALTSLSLQIVNDLSYSLRAL